MRAKKSFLIASFLCTWSLISYFLLIRQTDTGQNARHPSIHSKDNRRKRDDFVKQMNDLETNIYKENELHDHLVKLLVEIVQLKNVNNGQQSQGAAAANALANQNLINDTPIKNNNGVDKNVIFGYENNNIADTAEGKVEAEAKAEVGADGDAEPFNKQAKLDARLRQLNSRNGDNLKGPIIPVLVFACNRISVRNCLDDLVRYRPNNSASVQQFPIIVSQDCNDEPTKNIIESYKEVTFMRQPDQSDVYVLPKEKKFKGYYKIARHYGWALNTTFKAGFEYVIIVEDDLNVSPDFYDYFMGTHELLKNDSSLWCVSAWNDNGKDSNIDLSSPELLYRTDFFPGLGWMLRKDLWNELSVKWPKAFWDDWIRQPQQRKDRACIRPEIPRTRTFGKIGVSNGLFFDKHLRYIRLNEKSVDFTKMNLTYLLKSNYDKHFIDHVYSCPVVTFEEIRRGLVTTKGSVRIPYNTKDQYKRTAKLLGLMDDFKSGVPRTGYHGIVSFFYNHQRVYLAPNNNWKGYDLTWS